MKNKALRSAGAFRFRSQVEQNLWTKPTEVRNEVKTDYWQKQRAYAPGKQPGRGMHHIMCTKQEERR